MQTDITLEELTLREDKIIDIIASCEASIGENYSIGKHNVMKTMELLLDKIRIEKEVVLAGYDDSDEKYEEIRA